MCTLSAMSASSFCRWPDSASGARGAPGFSPRQRRAGAAHQRFDRGLGAGGGQLQALGIAAGKRLAGAVGVALGFLRQLGARSLEGAVPALAGQPAQLLAAFAPGVDGALRAGVEQVDPLLGSGGESMGVHVWFSEVFAAILRAPA